ncbi:hypothetical protein FSP39_001083 [Pinctada imbricata]|uniref:Transmembrane protein 26 n=1 Tax=Pinctada imbricata TaxID=66713 RepID=A0AA88XH76_PINIB|nr:hypothetical protein FSP39_001083 [Pinctada imbricata]
MQEETGVPGEKPPAKAWVGDHLPSNIRPIAESEIRSRDLRGEKRARYHCANPATTAFSPCFFIYLCCTFPGLWILESDRFGIFNDTFNMKNNGSEITNTLTEIYGVTLPFELDKDTWVSVLEQLLLVIILIGRWLLPHRALTHDQLSTVMLIYIGPAFDVMELLIIFEEPVIRNDKSLSLAIFIVWTVSFLQFTLLLPSNGKKQKAASDKSKNDRFYMFCDYEVLGLIIYTLLMDVPFFVVRMYAIIHHQLFKDGLIFFAAKNFMLIIFTMYRVSVKCITLNRHSHTKESSRETASPCVINMAFIPENNSDQTEDNNKCASQTETTCKTEDNNTCSVSFTDNDNCSTLTEETENETTSYWITKLFHRLFW